MRENIVAKILLIIGVAIMVIGLITGIGMGYGHYHSYFGFESGIVWSIFFSYLFAGFMIGMLFIGLSEIIKLLHSINERMHFTKHQTAEPDRNTTMADNQPEVPSESNAIQPALSESVEPVQSDPSQPSGATPKQWALSETDREKITDLYCNEQILDMIPSNIEGYCVVKMMGSDDRQFVRIVDVCGFGAEEINDPDLKQQIITWYNKRAY
ncbi:hypothetical protein ABRT01_06025 [Lentibacillus sp. L22]|uniref:hypothetical protein n=1 Tax=Lentibacillus TaxID=175304 RepID=UPI0022B0A3B8|nr:hypothetical protein [Lentibacillus daqui]